jgi:hypothetical protein
MSAPRPPVPPPFPAPAHARAILASVRAPVPFPLDGHGPGVQARTASRPPPFPALSVQASSQSCDATLTIADAEYEGSTGNDHGHAEMDALHKFVTKFGSDEKGISAAVAALGRARKKAVQCESRPVCKKCSAVLKGLGFKPKDAATEWGDKPMGSTEWGCSLAVQALFKKAEVDYEAIKALS